MVDTLSATLREIVGAEHVRAAAPSMLIDGVQPALVVEPADAAEVGRVLRAAQEVGASVIPHGGGTKMSWGNAPRDATVVLSMRRLNRVVEHAWGDLTATVEAGCAVADVQRTLAAHQQQLAVESLWPELATVGGVLATNDGGASRLRFGSLRDLITGITVALPDGTVARSGGRVVKNVAGYDLPKLMIGSLGTLGVIVEATFRLYPLPAHVQTICCAAPSVEAAHEFMLDVRNAPLTVTGLQLTVGSDAAPEIALRVEGHAARDLTLFSLAEKIKTLSRHQEIKQVITDDKTWARREELWINCEQSLICKISVLPTQLARVCHVAGQLAQQGKRWSLVAQSFGLCALRVDLADEEAAQTIETLRAEIEELKGSLVVLHCPAAVKKHVDVWGPSGDALPLMRRVKQQFDPSHVLNPHRFVGGI